MRLALRSFRATAIVLIIAGMPRLAGSAAMAGEQTARFAGTWKLIVLALGEDEHAIINVNEKDGKPAASVVDSQKMMLGHASVEQVAIQGDSLVITLRGAAGLNRFQGTLAREGSEAGKILGSFSFRGEVYPARLERTESQKVADLKPSAIIQEYFTAVRERDPKSKVQKLRDAAKKHEGNPTNYFFYGELLAVAEAGGLAANEVEAAIKALLEDAKPYGQPWVSEVRKRALKALSTARPYANLTLDLAGQADKEIDEEQSLEQKAAVVAILARTARLAGKADLARAAETRSARLESRLDQEYRNKVPPFAPEKYAGRKDPKADHVVLIELFTGAQCPPCVAADVAFDALLETYQATELIGLQYHLHIPGPDPLTNKDSQARQQYYGDEVSGTPAVFFNGHPDAAGGGPMQLSEQKYKEYRGIIDSQLEAAREATIHVSATRNGDEIKIAAQATVTRKRIANDNAPAPAKDVHGDAENASKAESCPHLRLRLALTEESIRYIGINKLRYHHHVVRDFPGGLEGRDLSSGSGELRITINLADLKRDIENSLSLYSKERAFPNSLPEIALKDLSVVAFVQDDADKSILHAVAVPVK
jgi:hypothetical protein